MRPEEIRSRGVALAERVRSKVDTSQRLEIMIRSHRRRRVVALSAAAAVVMAVLVGVLLMSRVEEPPVITVPPTTVPSTETVLRSLPVEVFMVLRGDYSIDEASGACEGTGPLSGIGGGSEIHVFDESEFQSADDAPTITLPAGSEATAGDPQASLLLSPGELSACVFSLPDLGFDIADYEHVSLFPAADPDVSMGSSISGQRVVFSFGEARTDVDFPAGSVASENPETLQAELRALRDSSGPGRIVGFINMSAETSTGAPRSPAQPMCVGTGGFSDITPGSPVVVRDDNGEVIGEGMLRGSVFDAHIGCSLWFGLDVVADLDSYLISVGSHAPVVFQSAVLDEFNWRIELWTDPLHMQPNCVELEVDAEPMTCVLIEPD